MAVYMAFRSTTYTRATREKKCVEMRFPLSCWTEIASSLLQLAAVTLPPAKSDFQEYPGMIKTAQHMEIQTDLGNWSLVISIENHKSSCGIERMVLIEGMDRELHKAFVFTFPWVHLPVFNVYASRLNNELLKNKELYSSY